MWPLRSGRHQRQCLHTLITTEAGRYSGEVLKALELSETVVPAELRALWDGYKAKMAEEGKKVKVAAAASAVRFQV